MKRKFQNWVIIMKLYAREKRPVFIVYAVLRLIVLAALVLSIVNGDYDSAFICVLVLFLFLVPAFLQDRFSVEFPSALVFSVIGCVDVKRHGSSRIAKNLIPRSAETEKR